METIGGQALVEGVMMISPKKVAMSVRKKNGKIKSVVSKRKEISYNIKDVFFARGIFNLVAMLYLGTKALMWSSNENLEKDEKISSLGMTITLLFSFVLGIGLFVALPLWVSNLITKQHVLFNVVDGFLRVIIFIGYLLAIAQMRDVKRLFEYHGAEHMAVHCYEAKKQLEVKNVRRFSTLHLRCGTAFIFLVLLISIFIFSLIWSRIWAVKFALRILFIPVIAGISYEILKISAKHQDKFFFRMLIKPGLWFQKITTREPDGKQIEVAIASIKKVL